MRWEETGLIRQDVGLAPQGPVEVEKPGPIPGWDGRHDLSLWAVSASRWPALEAFRLFEVFEDHRLLDPIARFTGLGQAALEEFHAPRFLARF